MKHKFILAQAATLLYGCILLTSSCSKENDTFNIQPGNIPITFAGILEQPQTKVTSTSFEANDPIGLFATLTPSPLEDKRYIDNLLLTCKDGSTFTPAKTVFYPEGKATLDFICYHPYQSEGVAEGNSILPVTIQSDQSLKENFSKSDFLLAKKTNVGSSENAVELNFKHKFAKLQFSILPGEDEDAESILDNNPQIIVTGICSQANYNLSDESITDLTQETDIVTHGSWSNEEGKLIGKEAIIIPQSLNSERQSIILEWNGRIYTCQMPELTMQAGTQCEISITATQSGNTTLTGIAGTVSDWTNMESEATDNTQENIAIHTSSLSFQTSDIYRVYYQGKPILDICKEYLKSSELTSRAIVAYPLSEDTEMPDLTKGTILRLLDTAEPICGGTLQWDIVENTFNYEKGDKALVDKFYVEESGTLNLTSHNNAVSCNIVALTIRDVRSSKQQTYPIVKIGTQYWMKEDLRATCYRNGTPLTNQINQGEGAGYFKPEDLDIYFYNGEAVLADELSPEGWSLPTDLDWESLKTYIGNDVSLLKGGEWQVVGEEEGTPAPVNNLTGFSILANGSWMDGLHNSYKQINGYWALKESGKEIADKIIFFTGNINEFHLSDPIAKEGDFYKVLSIRCIKK